MSLINVSIQHGCTFDDARTRLETTVQEVTNKFGRAIQRVDWNAERTEVKLAGPGVQVEMRIDPELVHVSGDIPLLGGLLGSKLTGSLKSILSKTFPKQLEKK
jgi:hypothetical protein